MTAERFKRSTAEVLDGLAFDDEAEAVGEMSEAELDAEMAPLALFSSLRCMFGRRVCESRAR